MHSNGCVNNGHTVPYIEIATVCFNSPWQCFCTEHILSFSVIFVFIVKTKVKVNNRRKNKTNVHHL